MMQFLDTLKKDEGSSSVEMMSSDWSITYFCPSFVYIHVILSSEMKYAMELTGTEVHAVDVDQ